MITNQEWFIAAQNSNVYIENHINECKTLKNAENKTALMISALGYVECVRALVPHEYGIVDQNCQSALMIAAQKGQIESIYILVQYEIGIVGNNGCTALYYAIQNSHLDCATLLVQEARTTMNDELWFLSAEKCFTQLLSLYVDQYKTRRNQYGQTALMIVSKRGSSKCGRVLAPYEIGLHDNNGNTALMHAVASQMLSKQIVSILAEKEICMRDEQGRTALMQAKPEFFSLLQKELLMVDNKGESALMHNLKQYGIQCASNTILYNEIGIKSKNGNCALKIICRLIKVYDPFQQFKQHEIIFISKLIEKELNFIKENEINELKNNNKLTESSTLIRYFLKMNIELTEFTFDQFEQLHSIVKQHLQLQYDLQIVQNEKAFEVFKRTVQQSKNSKYQIDGRSEWINEFENVWVNQWD